MECKNCKQQYEGSYCNLCGQKSNTKRLDFLYLRNEITTSILQLDRGILFTIKELLTRPGHSIRDFIEGKRIKHFKPLAFLFVAASLFVIANKIIGNTTFIDQFLTGIIEGGGEELSSTTLAGKFLKWVIDYQPYAILLAMLAYSFASYLAFIKSGYNLIEHLVLNAYISGLQFLIYTIFSFFISEDKGEWTLIPLLLGFLFNFWTYIQFFEAKKFLPKMVLFVLTYLLYISFLFVSFGIIGVLSMLNLGFR